MKKFIGYLFTFLLVGLIPPNYSHAAEFREPDDRDGNIVVSQDEKVKNLYTGGNLVSIDADVEKSLTAGGNFITIKGNVEENLMVGGGTVTVRGDVGGTAYVGGGNVIIEGSITDDLFIGGGTVTIAETASIGGDLIAGGGVVNVYGPVTGRILLGAGQATINNTVGGDIRAEVEVLHLGDKAKITGDVFYKSQQEAVVSEDALVLGNIEFDQMTAGRDDKSSWQSHSDVPNSEMIFKVISLGLIMKFIITLTSTLVLIYFFKKLVEKVSSELLANFWSNFGMGFATLFLTPILSFILLITVIGSSLSVLTMSLYSLMILLSTPLASIALGSWLMKSFTKAPNYSIDWKSTILGVLVMSLVGLIPPLGWMTRFIFTMASLGTLSQLFFKVIKKSS